MIASGSEILVKVIDQSGHEKWIRGLVARFYLKDGRAHLDIVEHNP